MIRHWYDQCWHWIGILLAQYLLFRKCKSETDIHIIPVYAITQCFPNDEFKLYTHIHTDIYIYINWFCCSGYGIFGTFWHWECSVSLNATFVRIWTKWRNFIKSMTKTLSNHTSHSIILSKIIENIPGQVFAVASYQ